MSCPCNTSGHSVSEKRFLLLEKVTGASSASSEQQLEKFWHRRVCSRWSVSNLEVWCVSLGTILDASQRCLCIVSACNINTLNVLHLCDTRGALSSDINRRIIATWKLYHCARTAPDQLTDPVTADVAHVSGAGRERVGGGGWREGGFGEKWRRTG